MVLYIIKMVPKGQKHNMEKKLLYWGMRNIGKLLTDFASTALSEVLIPRNPECSTWVLLPRNTTSEFWKSLMKASSFTPIDSGNF